MATHSHGTRDRRRTNERPLGDQLARCDGPCGQARSLALLTTAWVGAYCPDCLPALLSEWRDLRLAAVRGEREAAEWWAQHAGQLTKVPRPYTASRRSLNELIGVAA